MSATARLPSRGLARTSVTHYWPGATNHWDERKGYCIGNVEGVENERRCCVWAWLNRRRPHVHGWGAPSPSSLSRFRSVFLGLDFQSRITEYSRCSPIFIWHFAQLCKVDIHGDRNATRNGNALEYCYTTYNLCSELFKVSMKEMKSWIRPAQNVTSSWSHAHNSLEHYRLAWMKREWHGSWTGNPSRCPCDLVHGIF